MRKFTTTLLIICLATIGATAQTAKIYDFAGNANLGNGYTGDGGLAIAAQMWSPSAIAFDASGNLYIGTSLTVLSNSIIRMVNTAGVISTFAGTGSAGYSGDGGPATAAELSSNINAMVFDGSGNLYIADAGNSVVRMVNTAGIISTYFGNGGTVSVPLSYITGLAWSSNTAIFGSEGGLLVSQTGGTNNNAIYLITLVSNSLLTDWGGATAGNIGDGTAVNNAEFNRPSGIAFDPSGSNLYIADADNNRIRKVTMTSTNSATWVISNFAGNSSGTSGASGDGGQATAAKLSQPNSLCFDATGNLYIADTYNNRIRKVNTAGVISTIVSTTGNSTTFGYNGDAITATTALLNSPQGVTCDASGNVYIADLNNNEVREVTTSCIPPTILTQPRDTNVCANTNTDFIVTWINSTGYQWQVNKGSGFINNTQSAPNSAGSYMDTINIAKTSMNGWQYQCIVKGCSNITSNAATLTIISPTITCNAPIICAGSGASATLTASGASSGTYNWSTGDATDYIVESPTVTTTYTVTGTDNVTTCTGTGIGTITVLQPQVPTICEVTTDSTTNYKYNYIYWNSSLYSKVDSFIIYRYDAGSGHYLRIGSRANDSLSVYIDKDSTIGGPHGGNPAYASWKYTLAIRDSCGNIGAKGPYHQSIFVQQTGQNFSWTAYVDSGITILPTGYAFLRDSLGIGDYHVLANVSSTSSTDPNYTSYPNAVYRVDALGFNCTPTTARLSGNNSVYAAKVKSHSNTNNNRAMTTGINKTASTYQVSVYPNPNNGSFVITTSENTKTILITDVLGNELLSVSPNGNATTNVNLSAQPNGVYFIKVISDNAQIVKRIIINN